MKNDYQPNFMGLVEEAKQMLKDRHPDERNLICYICKMSEEERMAICFVYKLLYEKEKKNGKNKN